MQSYVSDVRNIASQPHEYSSPTKSKIQALRIVRIGSPLQGSSTKTSLCLVLDFHG